MIRQVKAYKRVWKNVSDEVGVFSDEGPPVPIPNTEVKLISADNTWLEAAREDKAMPTQYRLSILKRFHNLP